MKNFLILVLALGLAGSAVLTRPDREEFEAYLRHRQHADAASSATPTISVSRKGVSASASSHAAPDAVDADKLVFKDYYLWSVVRDKDGKSLFTGAFDHWVDNEQIRRCLPSDSKAE